MPFKNVQIMKTVIKPSSFIETLSRYWLNNKTPRQDVRQDVITAIFLILKPSEKIIKC